MSDQFKERIKSFYDNSAELWVSIWGEHMHHGYYPEGRGRIRRDQAQINLIEALIAKASINPIYQILDVGCGVGGSARFLAQRFDARVTGLTLSPAQKSIADRINFESGLEERVVVLERDVLSLGPEDGIFDLIWCVECLEHIEYRARLFHLLSNAQENGGTLLMTTWCLTKSTSELNPSQARLLEKIYASFDWSPLETVNGMQSKLTGAGYRDIEFNDWSEFVVPFWSAVRKSAVDLRNVRYISKLRWSVVKGAFNLRFLQKAYNEGLIEYVAVSCVK